MWVYSEVIYQYSSPLPRWHGIIARASNGHPRIPSGPSQSSLVDRLKDAYLIQSYTHI